MIRPVEVENNDILYVSDDGKVFHNGKQLKPHRYKSGYLSVHNQGKNYLIHRLVASAFISPLKRGDRNIQVHHINENKADNRLENLEVISVGEHCVLHKQKYPRIKKCVICGKDYEPYESKRKESKTCSRECMRILAAKNMESRKRPINQISLDGMLIRKWDSARDAQRETGFFESNINKCCHGIINTYKGYVWQYANQEI